MANNVNILLKARDDASRKIGGLTKSIIGLGASYIGIRTLTRAVRGSVAAFNTQVEAETKLAAALTATGNAVGFTTDQLLDYASTLQQTTTYSDEAITEMMSIFASFKNIQNETFTEGTALALDMSVAMKQDLKSTIVQLGKALNDPVKGLTALSRVGVSFTAEQTEMIKKFAATNDIAAAQKIILGELASEFGGQAAAQAKTFGGQLEQLKNAFGDASEEIGGMITRIPGLVDAMGFLKTAFLNFKLSADIVWTTAALGMVRFWEQTKWTFSQIPVLVKWAMDNWKEIFITTGNFIATFITNIGKNLWSFFQAVTGWLKGDGFDFEWTALTEGFESSIKQMPEILARNIGPVEQALMDELANMKLEFGGKLAGDLASAAPTGSGTGGASIASAADAARKKVGATEARFLSGGSGTNYAKDTAKESKSQTRLLAKIDAKMGQLTEIRNNVIKETAFS